MSDLISRQEALAEFIDGRDVFDIMESIEQLNPVVPNSDLISRADAIEAIASRDETDGTVKVFAGREVNEILSALPSAEAVQGEWIPFTKRPLTDEEKQEYPDWAYIFDCPLPDDEEEILLSNGKHVWMDTFINDGECYLDGGDDIDEGMAWMPLPEPYKEEDNEN